MPDTLDKLKFYDKEDRPWPGKRLDRGAIVGHTTDTTTRIWVRVKEEGKYGLAVAPVAIDTDHTPQYARGRLRLLDPAGNTHPFEGNVHPPVNITFETDNTHVFDVEGLSPNTQYHYALFRTDRGTRGWTVGRDADLTFATRNPDAGSVTFGLYSCHMPYDSGNVQNMHMWQGFGEMLEDLQADFIIGCGDQVYTDGDKAVSIWSWLKKNLKKVAQLGSGDRHEVMLSWYRDIYRGYWGHPNLRNALRNYPTYMVWDDHEIMDGWGSYTDDELSNALDTIWVWEDRDRNLELARAMFDASRQVYLEYQHSHNPKTGAQGRPGTMEDDQWDYSFEWGHAAFYVLDMRGHRDFRRPESKILGAQQNQRVRDWLGGDEVAGSTALFLVSPVPVVHLKDFVANYLDLPALGIADDLRDEWEHESNWDERNRLLDEVFEFSHQTGKPVVFLSGDVHIGAAFQLHRRGKENARVFQLTSSGITYCKAPGKVLRLITRENGDMAGIPDGSRTWFERLHIFDDNNFGFLRTQTGEDDAVNISWDLYGKGERPGELVRLKRLKLT